jgi:tetratricopeptide (TPR) repeat protein
LALGRVDEAVWDAQKTIAVDSDWPKGYYRLGSAYMAMCEWSAATAAFRKGAELSPDSKEMVRDAQLCSPDDLNGKKCSRTTLTPEKLNAIALIFWSKPLFTEVHALTLQTGKLEEAERKLKEELTQKSAQVDMAVRDTVLKLRRVRQVYGTGRLHVFFSCGVLRG